MQRFVGDEWLKLSCKTRMFERVEEASDISFVKQFSSLDLLQNCRDQNRLALVLNLGNIAPQQYLWFNSTKVVEEIFTRTGYPSGRFGQLRDNVLCLRIARTQEAADLN